MPAPFLLSEKQISDEHAGAWHPIGEVAGWVPETVSGALDYLGLKWQNGYRLSEISPLWAGSAAYKEIGSSLFPNNLAFYAEGVQGKVQRLKLTANINEPELDHEMSALLDDAADLLIDAVLGSGHGDILRGLHLAPGSRLLMGEFWVESSLEIWPSGKGWSRRFVIRVPDFS